MDKNKAMAFLYLKALHIIFVVTWFAGLFYIVRIFIYHVEAQEKPSPEREILTEEYKRNARRLWYGITWPSAILTLAFGLGLLHYYVGHIPIWLWTKLAFVLGLYIYHFICHRYFLQLQKGKMPATSFQLRLWNEVATLFLVAIVFLVILKNTVNMLWGLLGLVVFSIVLMLAIRIYKRIREQSEQKTKK